MARRVPRNNNTPALIQRSAAGRPTKLTDDLEARLLEVVEQGNHLTTAAASVGISNATLHRWVDMGNNVEDAIAKGKPYDPEHLRFLDFRDRLAQARAVAEMDATAVVRRSYHGGFLTHEKPLQNLSGEALYDNDGNILVERTYSQPDGRLALAYLGRSRPSQWGQSAAGRVEITGAGGGPVQHELGVANDQISTLAARIAEVAAQQRAEDAENEGDVIDAVIVGDTNDGPGE